jgi:integron integrase
MTDAPAGPRLRRSVVPLECLTPPRWAHEADLKGSSAPPSPGSPTSALSPAPTGGPATAKVLVQRLRQVVRQRHYSLHTEKSYAGWARRFLVFYRYPGPARLGPAEVRAYLTHLAMRQHVSASTQNQAFSALLFLFREVLGRKLEQLDDTPRAKRSVRLPVILARPEVRAILSRLRGRPWLVASLMYGGGLRLEECLSLRVKDVDFERRVLVIRDGKGRKDRETVFPQKLMEPLRGQLERVRGRHEGDLMDGRGAVSLPDALERKYPRAAWELGWQWLFPAAREYVDPQTGVLRRHHLHQTVATGISTRP